MNALVVRVLGRRAYEPVWRAMQAFTAARAGATRDELWVVEHWPVFTLGQSARLEHLLSPGDIPVVHVDRGGQVTYHGPGQLVVYLLLDLRRLGIGVHRLVVSIEDAVVALLEEQGVRAQGCRGAPGVYVAGRKIAALGLRVRRGCTYHGLSVNVDMDLGPFKRINPCGQVGLETTQLKDLGVRMGWRESARRVCQLLAERLGYSGLEDCDER